MRYKVVDLRLESTSPFEVNGVRAVKYSGPVHTFYFRLKINRYYKIETGNSPCSLFCRNKYNYVNIIEAKSTEWVKTEYRDNEFYITVIECAHQLLELELSEYEHSIN